jgi:hypothetical protein
MSCIYSKVGIFSDLLVINSGITKPQLQGSHSQFLAGKAAKVQWGAHQRHAAAATATFYSAKSKQGLGLGGLASCGGPELRLYYNHIHIILSRHISSKYSEGSLSSSLSLCDIYYSLQLRDLRKR